MGHKFPQPPPEGYENRKPLVSTPPPPQVSRTRVIVQQVTPGYTRIYEEVIPPKSEFKRTYAVNAPLKPVEPPIELRREDGGTRNPLWWLVGCIVAAIFLTFCVAAARSEIIARRFSPNGGAQALIIEYTDKAKKEIYWQAYNFTSQPTADALKRAHARGVHVVVILDYTASRQKGSKAAELAKAGITVYLDNKHAIAHDKTRIFDGKVVLTGSYNDSASAETRNGESLFAFDDKDDVEACIANFKKHLLHSVYLDTKEPEKP